MEFLCSELAKKTRALLSELQLPFNSRPKLMAIVLSALDNTALKRNMNNCPMELFTFLTQYITFAGIRNSRVEYDFVSLEQCKGAQIKEVAFYREDMEKIHREVSRVASAKRRAAIESHNRKIGVRFTNLRKNICLEMNTAEKLHENYHCARQDCIVAQNAHASIFLNSSTS